MNRGDGDHGGRDHGGVNAFAIDLHVHTRRYSPCAEFMREQHIAEWARQAGLAGVVLTDHDVMWSEEEIRPLREAAGGVRLYRGIECSGADCHVLVIGVDDAAGFVRGMSFTEIAARAHRGGGVAILAHPYRDADPERLAVEHADAIEIGSTSFTRDEARRARQLADRFGKPMVASSDAHALSRLAWAWTNFPRLPTDERELAEMIRRGHGTPVVPRPFPA